MNGDKTNLDLDAETGKLIKILFQPASGDHVVFEITESPDGTSVGFNILDPSNGVREFFLLNTTEMSVLPAQNNIVGPSSAVEKQQHDGSGGGGERRKLQPPATNRPPFVDIEVYACSESADVDLLSISAAATTSQGIDIPIVLERVGATYRAHLSTQKTPDGRFDVVDGFEFVCDAVETAAKFCPLVEPPQPMLIFCSTIVPLTLSPIAANACLAALATMTAFCALHGRRGSALPDTPNLLEEGCKAIPKLINLIDDTFFDEDETGDERVTVNVVAELPSGETLSGSSIVTLEPGTSGPPILLNSVRNVPQFLNVRLIPEFGYSRVVATVGCETPETQVTISAVGAGVGGVILTTCTDVVKCELDIDRNFDAAFVVATLTDPNLDVPVDWQIDLLPQT